MQAVILAAGENRRLWERVEPFGKPLVDIGGKPLLEHLVELANAHCNRVVIVASVENVKTIRDLVGARDDVRIVIQPAPVGPGDALLRGLEACDSDNVLVLCGDNVMDRHAVTAIAQAEKASVSDATFVVGVTYEKNEREALRYTRVTCTDRFVEGPVDDRPRDSVKGWMIWLGPLVVPRKHFSSVLRRGVGEFIHFRIGPHLNELPHPRFIELSRVRDIGTPDELDAAKEEAAQ